MTRTALILSLVASLLWPWAAAAATCAERHARADACCQTACACEPQQQEEAEPCGCCAKEAPTAPTERAPAAPATNAPELDRALDLAPTIDLAPTLRVTDAHAARDLARAPRAETGRSVLLRACRLRH